MLKDGGSNAFGEGSLKLVFTNAWAAFDHNLFFSQYIARFVLSFSSHAYMLLLTRVYL